MNKNIECLVEALRDLKIRYEFMDPEHNLVRVGASPYYYFSYHKVPLNTEDVLNLANDKGYTYYILKDVINTPKSICYLDPKTTEEYQEYLKFFSVSEILDDIEKNFSYPLIIKKNRGYMGINVFLCQNKAEAETALITIYDRKSRDFDYVAIAQEYIKPKAEYRANILDGKVKLLYLKDTSQATFAGNLSPLHFEGGKAVRILDENKIKQIEEFIKPVFSEVNLRYGGLDIIESEDGKQSLIELNAYPGYSYFIRDNGKAPVVELYKDILRALNQ